MARNADEWYVTSRMPAQRCDPRQARGAVRLASRYRALAGVVRSSSEPARCPKCCPNPLNGKLSVIGDSHATAYLPLFDQLSAELGVKVNVYTYPGCAVCRPSDADEHRSRTSCVAFARRGSGRSSTRRKSLGCPRLALRQPRFADQWAAFDQSEVLAVAQSDTSAAVVA